MQAFLVSIRDGGDIAAIREGIRRIGGVERVEFVDLKATENWCFYCGGNEEEKADCPVCGGADAVTYIDPTLSEQIAHVQAKEYNAACEAIKILRTVTDQNYD